jgi:hypothetical protein
MMELNQIVLCTLGDFQWQLRCMHPAAASRFLTAGLPPEVTMGMASLYMQLVQPSKTARMLFTKAMLRRFDAAASLTSGTAAPNLS